MAVASIQGDDARAAATEKKVRRFNVDLWATSLNTVEIGIMKNTQHRAKSDYFTKDTDVIGEIKEDGERTGLVAYRMDAWNKDADTKRRLIIKLFSEGMSWRGTMDMMVGRSLQLTHGADGVPVTAFALNLARHEQIVQLERSANKWWFFPEIFSFFLLDDNGVAQHYKLKQRIFSFGRDYILYDQRDRRVGELDGRLVSVGGYWKVWVNSEHDNARMAAVLQLFCTMLRFNKEARRHVKQLSQKIRRGELGVDIERHERMLYWNPRGR